MSLHAQLRPLLAQFVTATGRGNMIVANQLLVRIVEILALAIEQRPGVTPIETMAEEVSLDEPEPEVIWDRPRMAPEAPSRNTPEPPKRRKPVRKTVRRKKPL